MDFPSQEDPINFLYLVGKIHAIDPFFNRAIVRGLDEARASYPVGVRGDRITENTDLLDPNVVYSLARAGERYRDGQERLAKIVEQTTADAPNFTLSMHRELFDRLSGDIRLYSTEMPHDSIPTVAALRERMLTPGYRVSERPNLDTYVLWG